MLSSGRMIIVFAVYPLSAVISLFHCFIFKFFIAVITSKKMSAKVHFVYNS